MTITTPLLCYDDQCILCSKTMQWYLRHEQSKELLFTPIGSEIYNALGLDSLKVDSILLVTGDNTYQESSAVLELIKRLKRPYSLLRFCNVIPRRIRDVLYSFIAKNRYKVFGKQEGCSLDLKQSGRIILTSHQYLESSLR